MTFTFDYAIGCVWRGLRVCALAAAAFVLLLLVVPEVLCLAAWYTWARKLPPDRWPEPSWFLRQIDMLARLRDELGLDVDTHSEHPYNAGESNNKNAKEAIMSDDDKYVVDNEDELKDMVREVVDMLDVVEESDSGTEFHPTHFSSCRTAHVMKFNELWPKIKAAVRPVKLAKKALKESDAPELVGFGNVNGPRKEGFRKRANG